MSPQVIIAAGAMQARLQQAVTHKVAGEYEDAERLLRSILAEDPENSQAYRELGLVLGFTGMFDESIEALQRAVQLDPQYVDARNDLGMSYAMLGMVDEAKAEFETVLEMDPANAMAQRQIIYFQ